MLIFMNGQALESIFLLKHPSFWLCLSWVINRINVQNEAYFFFVIFFDTSHGNTGWPKAFDIFVVSSKMHIKYKQEKCNYKNE